MAAVRAATESDLPKLVEMGRRFHDADAREGAPFDAEAFRMSLVWLLDAPNGILLVSERGMIGGIVFPLFFNSGFRVAQELFWWAEDSMGGELLLAFQDEAIRHGARRCVIGALAGLREEAVARLLRARGYAPSEHLYARELHG